MWYEIVEARVWFCGVVVDPPIFDDLSSVEITVEQMLSEAFVSQGFFATLFKAVLHGIS